MIKFVSKYMCVCVCLYAQIHIYKYYTNDILYSLYFVQVFFFSASFITTVKQSPLQSNINKMNHGRSTGQRVLNQLRHQQQPLQCTKCKESSNSNSSSSKNELKDKNCKAYMRNAANQRWMKHAREKNKKKKNKQQQ